jgi:negative regulator of replication initiation
MKKLLLLSALLIASFVQAQDYAYLTSLNKIATDKEAIKIAEEIASLQTKKVRLLRSQEFTEERQLLVRFVPEEMTNEQYDALDQYEQSDFLTVTFRIDYVGENKDLERQGVKTYKFKQLKGTYLQIFPVWKKYYHPEAEIEPTLTDSKIQKFVDFPKKIDFYIQEDNERWILLNQSRS